jgi:hypothetical protein
MRQKFLVLYDYGQGGLWAHLIADSEEQIRTRHPELVVMENPPVWMSAEEERQLVTIDIDEVKGTWLAIPPEGQEET